MAALGSSFVTCTALGKILVFNLPVTSIEDSPWEVAPDGITREAISGIYHDNFARQANHRKNA